MLKPSAHIETELSILGPKAHLSLTQRQAIRDRLFQKIGQATLVDAMQTHTEVRGLIMPLKTLRSIFQPKRIVLSVPATIGLLATVFAATFTTSAFARDAKPGELLFPVRKAFEAVQIALVTDPAQKAEVQLAIVSDRLEDIRSVDSKKLPVAVKASKDAIANIQSTIATLPEDEASIELAERLKTLIDTRIVTGKEDSTEIKQTILAVKKELETVLANPKVGDTSDTPAAATVAVKPADTSKSVTNPKVTVPAALPVTLDPNRTEFQGTITANFGIPALIENNQVYTLSGVTVDLMPYIGKGGVFVTGHLQGNTIIVTSVYIDSKLIWKQPTEGSADKNNNSLTRVDNVQN